MTEPMAFAEQIRHPSGALNPPRERERKPNRILWLLFLAVVVVIVAWRMGWLAEATSAVKPIANPRGWV